MRLQRFTSQKALFLAPVIRSDVGIVELCSPTNLMVALFSQYIGCSGLFRAAPGDTTM